MSDITASVEKTTIVTLKLTEESAKILMALTQNSLHENEQVQVSKFRSNLWKALENQGIKLP